MINFRTLTFLLLLFSFLSTSAQVDKNTDRTIGINYFGEFGFRPGLEIDYGIPIFKIVNERDLKKRSLMRAIVFRPSLAYYYYSHNSHNFLTAVKLNYQLTFIKKPSSKYFFLEPFLKFGYHRKSFLGEIYKTTNQGIEQINYAGSNALAVGSGLDFGGSFNENLEWLSGLDYLLNITEDKLLLHRFVFKLGVRIKL